MDEEEIRPVICQGICTSQADDYCGMHMSNETCIACEATWTQAHMENKDWDIESLCAEQKEQEKPIEYRCIFCNGREVIVNAAGKWFKCYCVSVQEAAK